MELKEGMYVRTLDGICKVIELRDNGVMTRFRNEYGNIYFVNEMICNPSFEPIDLIEVGDYVNGNKVTKLGFDKLFLNCKTIECHQEDLSKGYEGVTFVYTNKDIKSIVTKEMFESMSYRVKE